MRLAVFTNQFPSRVSTFFARDIRALIEAGIDIEIFPIYPQEKELWQFVPDILNERIFSRDKVHFLNLVSGFRWFFNLPTPKRTKFLRDLVAISASAVKFGAIPLAKSLYVFPQACAWAKQYSFEFDHILSYWGNYSGTCAYLSHRFSNEEIPFSFFLHAEIDLYTNQVFLREKLNYADNIYVVCEYNRNFLQRFYPDDFPNISTRIHLHHLGLDLAELPYEPDNRLPGKILAVGRLELKKGFDYLVRAAGELIHRGVDVELDLIGDGTQAKALQILAKKLSIRDKVHFSGWIPFESVRAAMKLATVLVHPSPYVGDAVPTVIKEAMALGTPVVASDVAGIPELLNYGRCGRLVPPRDVHALAQAIEMVLYNESQRYFYAEAARKYTEEKFDLWRNGQRLASMLCSSTRGI